VRAHHFLCVVVYPRLTCHLWTSWHILLSCGRCMCPHRLLYHRKAKLPSPKLPTKVK
jgi:hypothetical protein